MAAQTGYGLTLGSGTGGGGQVGIADNVFGDTGQTADLNAGAISINPAPDLTTAEATRDSYFTANPANLAFYDNNPTLGIYLFYTDVPGDIFLFQVRSSGAWITSASLVAFKGEPGELQGPGTSTQFALATWADGNANLLLNNPGAILNSTPSQLALDLQSPSETGLINIDFNDSVSNQVQGRFSFSEFSNDISLIAFEGNDLNIQATESGSQINISNTFGSDTNPLVRFSALASTMGMHVGSRDPRATGAAISGNPGATYHRVGAVNDLYINVGTTPSNTDWRAVLEGSVYGPLTTTPGSVLTWTDDEGELAENNPFVTLDQSATFQDFRIQSPSVGGGGRLQFLKNNGDIGANIQYSDNLGNFGITVGGSAGAAFSFVDVDAGLLLVNLVGDDTTDLLRLTNSGATGGTTAITVGNRDPNLNVTGNPGYLIVGVDGVNSDIYFNRGAGTSPNNNAWSAVFGNRAEGPGTTVQPLSMTIWADSGGKNITDAPLLRAASSASVSEFQLLPPSSTGEAGVYFYDETGAGLQGTLRYNQSSNHMLLQNTVDELRLISAADMFHAVTGASSRFIFDGTQVPAANPLMSMTTGGANGTTVDFMFGDTNPITAGYTPTAGRVFFVGSETAPDIYLANGTNWIDILASGLKSVATLPTTTNGIMVWADENGDTVKEGVGFTVTTTGSDRRINAVTPDANGTIGIDFIGTTAPDTISLIYNEGLETSELRASGANHLLSLLAQQGPIEIGLTSGTDDIPIALFSNNENGWRVFSRNSNPEGQVEALARDFLIAGTGLNNVQAYLGRENTAVTNWAQFDLLQKAFQVQTNTSTLNRNFNRILAEPLAAISLSIPTPAATAKAQGFEQEVIKESNNDEIITIPSPGFYNFTGPFIISRFGDVVRYLQTASKNIITYTNRRADAVMRRTGNSELEILGATGAQIILTGFNNNTRSYVGLCEPDQANNRIVFPNVENLTSGDLYELSLTVVYRHSNNSTVAWHATVDDKGLTTNYALTAETTATSTSNLKTVTAEGLVRTGFNDNGGLDTSLQIYFTLQTGNSLWIKKARLKITKIDGE